MLKPLRGKRDVLRIKVDQYGVPAELVSYFARGAGSAEAIQYNARNGAAQTTAARAFPADRNRRQERHIVGRSSNFKAHLPFNQLARKPGFLQIADHPVPGGFFARLEPLGLGTALHPRRLQCRVGVPVSKVLPFHFARVRSSAELARAGFRGARKNAGDNQLFREGRKVGALIGLSWNVPNASPLPGIGDFIHGGGKGFVLPIAP